LSRWRIGIFPEAKLFGQQYTITISLKSCAGCG
jgi:hypothetical protein